MPGSAVCLANLAITQKHFEKLGRQGLLNWAKDVMTESQEKYCPVDTRRLRNSGKVTTTKNTLTEFFVRLSYSTPYAIYVHEIPATHTHGSMKYLSTPFNLRAHLLIQRLESELRKAV